MAKSKSAEMVPRLREDLVVTELPITDPFEGFILSRIDGETTIRDIADSTVGVSKWRSWKSMYITRAALQYRSF